MLLQLVLHIVHVCSSYFRMLHVYTHACTLYSVSPEGGGRADHTVMVNKVNMFVFFILYVPFIHVHDTVFRFIFEGLSFRRLLS